MFFREGLFLFFNSLVIWRIFVDSYSFRFAMFEALKVDTKKCPGTVVLDFNSLDFLFAVLCLFPSLKPNLNLCEFCKRSQVLVLWHKYS